MSAVTEADVKAIIDTTLEAEEIKPFLAAASTIVNDNLLEEEYGEDTLGQITCWLAAHFVAIRDPRVASEKLGDASVTYHGSSGLGLNHTPYGQQAMLLDRNGKLAQLNAAKVKASLEVIG